MCETDVIILSYSYEANLPANQMNLSAHIGQVFADANLVHTPTQEHMVQDGNPPSTDWRHFSTPSENSNLNSHGYSSNSAGENQTGGGNYTESDNSDTGSLGYSSDSENETGGGSSATTGQPDHFHFHHCCLVYNF
jgi:hypothetical protein